MKQLVDTKFQEEALVELVIKEVAAAAIEAEATIKVKAARELSTETSKILYDLIILYRGGDY